MKQWLAVVAAVAFLAVPAMVSAGEETVIPPEANWNSIPPTPAHLMISQERVVSTAQEPVSDTPLRPAAALSDEDAKYQKINATVHDD